MKKYLFVVVMSFMSLGLHAQDEAVVQVPDNDLIMREIIDANSPYNYTALISRYMGGDTTLTADDYRRLYYGYVWQSQYQPLDVVPYKDKMLMIFEKVDGHTQEDYENIIRYGTEIMKVDPFSPSNINFLTYAYGALGDTINERINYDRMNKIIETVKSSGTGIKEASPWHVISFDHALDVMNGMDVLYRKPMVVSRTTEFIPLTIKQSGTKGYYFNYERVYWKRPDKMPAKRSTGWEFNGIPIKKR